MSVSSRLYINILEWRYNVNEIKIFENSTFGKVRTVEMNGELYFVGKDVTRILGYENQNRDITRHVDVEDRIMLDTETQYQNGIEFDYKLLGQRGGWLINESGLYSLILSSKLPKAKEFKRWVTSEILPSIRRHGAYMTDDILAKTIENPDFLINLLNDMKKEKEKRKALEEKVQQDKPKVLFAECVEASNTSILVGDLAKLLKQNGVEIGQKRLFAWLRDNGYLMKSNSGSYNMPTQRSMEMGLFEVKEHVINNPDGSIRVTKTPKVTGKGQRYFVNKFLGNKEEM